MALASAPDLSDCRDRFSVALAEGNARYVETLVRAALAARVTPGDLHHEVIAPALVELGGLWARGLLTVTDQRLATEMCEHVLTLVAQAAPAPAPRVRARVLLATTRGERHGLGVRMAACALRAAGCDVRSLGSDVPPRDIAAAAARLHADVVGLSVVLEEAAEATAACARLLRASRVPVMIGGAAAGSAARELEDAVAIVPDVRQAAGAVAALTGGGRHLRLL